MFARLMYEDLRYTWVNISSYPTHSIVSSGVSRLMEQEGLDCVERVLICHNSGAYVEWFKVI